MSGMAHRGLSLAATVLITTLASGCDGKESRATGRPNLAVQRYMAVAKPGEGDLYRLSVAGPAGYDAGPSVMRLMDSDDWHLRSTAAFVLGSIAYLPAEQRLLQALENPADPLLNRKAAEALGHLGDTATLDALRRVSAAHWRTSVRVAATQAIRHIRDRSPYPTPDLLDLLDDDDVGDGLSRCTDDLFIYSRDRSDEQALDVPGGRLIGIDQGEWGGNLRFETPGRVIQPVLATNIFTLTTLGGRTIAVTGLLHMAIAQGAIYDISRDATGMWHATPWRGMDGPPLWTAMAKDGKLHIGLPTYTLLLSPDGTMEQGTCETPAQAGASGHA